MAIAGVVPYRTLHEGALVALEQVLDALEQRERPGDSWLLQALLRGQAQRGGERGHRVDAIGQQLQEPLGGRPAIEHGGHERLEHLGTQMHLVEGAIQYPGSPPIGEILGIPAGQGSREHGFGHPIPRGIRAKRGFALGGRDRHDSSIPEIRRTPVTSAHACRLNRRALIAKLRR